MTMKLFQKFAHVFVAYQNCLKSGNKEWEDKWSDAILNLCYNEMPSGSGIDYGVKFNWELSQMGDKVEKLIFDVPFHAMNDRGFYVGVIEYKIIVTPSLMGGFKVTMKGKDYNGLKNYLVELFTDYFSKDVE